MTEIERDTLRMDRSPVKKLELVRLFIVVNLSSVARRLQPTTFKDSQSLLGRWADDF